MLRIRELVTPMHGIENLTYEDANILLSFQRLWTEVVHWVRSYLHTVLGNLPEQRAIGNRLFRELPEDLYNEFRKYFNEEESQQFVNIISRFISVNWELVNAYKSKDRTSIDLSTVQWYESADELAAFLATVNKYYDETQLKTLLYEFLNLRVNEINSYLNGNHDLEMQIFSAVGDKAVEIASYMAMGIIAMRHASKLKYCDFINYVRACCGKFEVTTHL